MKLTRNSFLKLSAMFIGVILGVYSMSVLQGKQLTTNQYEFTDVKVVMFDVPKDARTVVVRHNLGTLSYNVGDLIVVTGPDGIGECDYVKSENVLTLKFHEQRSGRYQMILERRIKV